MIAFMTIIYIATVALVFKVFRVRPRPWLIALFVTGGILMIGGIVVLWTLAAPISESAVVTRYVVQIVPWVKGKALQSAEDAVVSAKAQLDSAKFNLAQCTVTTPADGFVTDWQIREGSMANPFVVTSVGAFIDTSETFIVASFPAEELIHVRPGQNVELAFKSRPGQLFHGKVENIIEATGEGQFAPGGKLPSAAQVGSPGFLAVKIVLDDKEQAAALALGTPAAVAIYTDCGKPFAMISKVAIRMQKWLYFLPLPPKT